MNVYIHIIILQNLGYGKLTVKSGIWDIGGVTNLGYGILGVKNLGYGILGGKKCGIWDMGTPVSPPPHTYGYLRLYWTNVYKTCISRSSSGDSGELDLVCALRLENIRAAS